MTFTSSMKSHPKTGLQEQVHALESLLSTLQQAQTFSEAKSSLDAFLEPQGVLPLLHAVSEKFNLTKEDSFLIESLAAIGQFKTAFVNINETTDQETPALVHFLEILRDVENCYKTIGGIVGYHLTVLKLILSQDIDGGDSSLAVSYEEPEGIDICRDVSMAKQAVVWGIKSIEKSAEIYPIGGAGDRLNLKDEKTGELLPAAQLLFCGRTLLEGMVRDLQARELLHYRLFQKQVVVPLALMTSYEKNNHHQVIEICEQSAWFGRPKDSFRFFIQPLVPVVTIEGNWAMRAPLKPILKPGGHGLMWKTAIEAGIFDWLEEQGRSYVLVRQINNPVAGVDNGLLALLGIGYQQQKSFGFASCPRILNTPEGMDVVKKTIVREGDSTVYEYAITNIEYVDFANKGIKDVPVTPGSYFSHFPSNTNILFADLQAVRKAVKVCPIPGMLINMKSKVVCLGDKGQETITGGRLESLMQNIADYIVDRFPEPLKKGEVSRLSTFLTYNERRKTISVTKQAYDPTRPILGTPEGCFYEMLQNYRDLLECLCEVKLPPQETEEEYIKKGPSFLALFHPAIGPLYDIVAQKIRRGRFGYGAELILEMAEVDLEDIDLDGSLLIEAEAVLGKKDPKGTLVYDEAACGKCTLHRVTIKNSGINRSIENKFWKMDIHRTESVRIYLQGNGEFFASDVLIEGHHVFEVPDGHRMEVFEKDGKLCKRLEKIKHSTWKWGYSLDTTGTVVLSKEIIQ